MKKLLFGLLLIALCGCQKEVAAPVGSCSDQDMINILLSMSDAELLQLANPNGDGFMVDPNTNELIAANTGYCVVNNTDSHGTTQNHGIYVAGNNMPSFKSSSLATIAQTLREYIKDCKCGL